MSGVKSKFVVYQGEGLKDLADFLVRQRRKKLLQELREKPLQYEKWLRESLKWNGKSFPEKKFQYCGFTRAGYWHTVLKRTPYTNDEQRLAGWKAEEDYELGQGQYVYKYKPTAAVQQRLERLERESKKRKREARIVSQQASARLFDSEEKRAVAKITPVSYLDCVKKGGINDEEKRPVKKSKVSCKRCASGRACKKHKKH